MSNRRIRHHITISVEVNKSIEEFAKQENRSISNFIETILIEHIKAKEEVDKYFASKKQKALSDYRK